MSKQSPWIAGINAVAAALEHDADNVREVLVEAGDTVTEGQALAAVDMS